MESTFPVYGSQKNHLNPLGRPLIGFLTMLLLSCLCPSSPAAQDCLQATTQAARIQCLEDRIRELEKRVVPLGTIVMWAGRMSEIPPGWELCDGMEGRPNLIDRFIRGARNSEHGAGQRGGSEFHDHGSETRPHVLTEKEMPEHTHKLGKGSADSDPKSKSRGNKALAFFGHGSGRGYKVHTTEPAGGRRRGHSHDLDKDAHLPPYYTLAFIIKVR